MLAQADAALYLVKAQGRNGTLLRGDTGPRTAAAAAPDGRPDRAPPYTDAELPMELRPPCAQR